MREEYPRPDFVREKWQSLNGGWNFSCGDKTTKIEVPFVCQSQMSGIGEKIKENKVTYERQFTVPQEWKGQEIYLHFGAVDYRCRVFINDHCVGSHTGGQTPFTFPIARFLNWKTESIRVEVEDPLNDESIPRGKQFWEDESKFIWYTQSTGIWQSVWIEPVSETRVEEIRFTPDIDRGTVKIDFCLSQTSALPCAVEIEIFFEGKNVFAGNIICDGVKNTLTVDVFKKKAMEGGAFHFTGNYWTPENPVLYDAVLQVLSKDTGKLQDRVACYFGMRKVHAEKGKIYLNNQPYYQKLLLDQGYWENCLMTAPSDEAYKQDIIKAKKMGFNGCRKHEKVEDPRFLYWADKLGFLVWEAMASFWVYTEESAQAFTREWMDVINRDYNHPCIIAWEMLNESWGVPRIYDDPQQQAFARSLYYMVKGLDQTRLVVSNDGWEMTESDVCAVHSYKHGEKEDTRQHKVFADSLKSVEQLENIMERSVYAKGVAYQGQPVVLTECGGIALAQDMKDTVYQDAVSDPTQGWGYTTISSQGFLEEYGRLIRSIYDSPLVCGFCYTQLTDVEQEKNGLLNYRHEYKFDPDAIRKINEQK